MDIGKNCYVMIVFIPILTFYNEKIIKKHASNLIKIWSLIKEWLYSCDHKHINIIRNKYYNKLVNNKLNIANWLNLFLVMLRRASQT